MDIKTAASARGAERDMIQADPAAEREGRPVTETAHPERLALLYQGILTGIVRLQSGKQPLVDAAAFQKRMESLLDEIEREGIKVGYRNQDIQDAHYPIIAFLDETIRRSNDPNRNQWTPLQAKRYGEAVAGEGVFERLKIIRNRRDSQDLADVLEIYALCFFLGYQGRYAVGDRSGLDLLMQDIREQIDRIRGQQPQLSPDGNLPITAQAPAVVPSGDSKWQTIAIICAAVAVAGWIVFFLILNFHTQGALSEITP